MRLYLDTSVYNRPFDDQTQVKIFLETQASISIFRLIAQKTITVINSPILEVENQRNSSPIRQQFMQSYLEQATLYQPLTPPIIDRARQLQTQGLKNFDALHIATEDGTLTAKGLSSPLAPCPGLGEGRNGGIPLLPIPGEGAKGAI